MLSKFQPFFALQKLQHITRQDILGGNFDVLRKKEQIKGRILLKGKNVERMYSKQLKILRNISDFSKFAKFPTNKTPNLQCALENLATIMY